MPLFSNNNPPSNICILRLSALGDICQILPLILSLQKQWPDTHLTWVIGKNEFQFFKFLPKINFIIFDKKKGYQAFKDLRQQLHHQEFDLLLHMQTAFRASLVSHKIKARIRLGFNFSYATELQWLFTNKKIQAKPRQHNTSVFTNFADTLGIEKVSNNFTFSLPAIKDQLPETPYILINPCSSKGFKWRNWQAKNFIDVINFIHENYPHKIILMGANTELERETAEFICQNTKTKPENLIGKTNINQLAPLIQNAQLLISPDSGPVHIAELLNTPTISLYAATNPKQTGPYQRTQGLINRYPEALKIILQKTEDSIKWGYRIKSDQAMQLITPIDVINKITQLMPLAQ
jgi:heptosyltransferase I